MTTPPVWSSSTNRDTGPIPVVEGLSGLSQGMSVIVVQRGPEIGQRFELSGERLTVGRSADADIMLDDVPCPATTPSSWPTGRAGPGGHGFPQRHAVNRQSVESTCSPGDMIQIGKFRLQYLHADEDHLAE